MALVGHVTINGDVVGTFQLDDSDKIEVTFHNKRHAEVRETLEFVAEEGLTLGLIVDPTALDPKYAISA